MLLVSDLPEIVLHHAGVRAPGWLPGAKIGVLVLFLGLTVAWRALRALRPYALVLLALFVLDIVVALVVIAALWLLTRDRAAFFLVKGDVKAPLEPVPWLGVRRRDETWPKFGFIVAAVAGLAVLVPTVIGLKPLVETLVRALPLRGRGDDADQAPAGSCPDRAPSGDRGQRGSPPASQRGLHRPLLLADDA